MDSNPALCVLHNLPGIHLHMLAPPQLQRIVIRVFSDGPNAKNRIAETIGEAAKQQFPELLRENHMVRVIVGCRARKDAIEGGAGKEAGGAERTTIENYQVGI